MAENDIYNSKSKYDKFKENIEQLDSYFVSSAKTIGVTKRRITIKANSLDFIEKKT
ncbi:hypothetical protein HYU23_00765 [Candidatus Woesearchaeota archaeon]|nr:hypothetical protein [Candidatus Woesearchaeota archaeon]